MLYAMTCVHTHVHYQVIFVPLTNLMATHINLNEDTGG